MAEPKGGTNRSLKPLKLRKVAKPKAKQVLLWGKLSMLGWEQALRECDPRPK